MNASPPVIDASLRVLLLPGWQDSGPGHWQTLWEQQHGFVRVEQADWDWPRRGDWMARLDEVLQEDARPAVLVAHSLGCQLVASWADHSRHTDRVRAALLVAPPDTEREDLPPNLFNWRPMRRPRLPFAATVLASSDDPYCELARAAGLAADWGADFVALGPRGHLNGDSGLGDWPEGLQMLRALVQRAS
ncbi:RBBP9/YdeN family alpha/beta hydrolase [Caldimonas tepidiphila]|uniref:RBBP9/YdeN family alpha/beta hydrolase n=1 Tax=Caldimonas tepidiphila TaxID=2315841 RepID=UPI000E5BE4C2|nr:alpha/beta fold hydrolase [Caldimonas tepidiphila]